MADEAAEAGARMETYNIAQFLGKIKDSDETRGHVPVYPGDVLVVDEATQVSTEDALRVVQVARRSGAMVVGHVRPRAARRGRRGRDLPPDRRAARVVPAGRGAPVQPAPGSARRRCGCARATSPRWPSTTARGRIYHGPQDRVFDDAVTLCLNGLPRRPGRPADGHVERDRGPAGRAWSASGWSSSARSAPSAEITLADGNQAGRGDLIRARLNTRIDADGQTLANRDVVRLESIARQRRSAGWPRSAGRPGPTSGRAPFFVPVAYLERTPSSPTRATCTSRRAATVDRGHLVVDSGANRSLVYIGATRGREKNTCTW